MRLSWKRQLLIVWAVTLTYIAVMLVVYYLD